MRGGDGDKEAFFQCLDRIPSGIHIDADFPSDDDEDDEDDGRASFSSAMGDHQFQSFRRHQAAVLLEDEDEEQDEAGMEDASKYDMWMSDEPMSIQERRRRLHQGLGMVSSRDLALRRHSTKKRLVDLPRSVSRRLMQLQQQPLPPSALPPADAPSVATAAATTTTPAPRTSGLAAARDMLKQPPAKPITRRRSDSFLAARDGTPGSEKPSLRRARSLLSPHDPCSSSLADKFKATRDKPIVPLPAAVPSDKDSKGDGDDGSVGRTKKQEKEGAVVAAPKDQSQTGVQLGLEEIEKFIGNTPIMKHLMRRGHSQHHSQPVPAPTGAAPPKGDKSASKKKGGWLKNIKSVAIGAFIQEKDGNIKPAPVATTGASPSTGHAGATAPPASSSSTSSEKLKVQNYGKSSKELTGLYMSQVLAIDQCCTHRNVHCIVPSCELLSITV
jgi:hypothetical protein